MPVIASQSSGAYFAAMPAAILKALTLLALVLMPFGMGAATAGPGDHRPAAAKAQHHDGHGGQPVEESARQSADCAIACSMLVNEGALVERPAKLVSLAAVPLLVERGTGLHPDTITPPPKLS